MLTSLSSLSQYAGTLEKRRSVLGPSSQPNLELKASLEMYDSRLNVLREQLRSSVDVKLKGSGAGAGVTGATGAPAGLGGVGALAAAGGDTIPAVKAAAKNARGDACNDTTKTSKSSIVDRLVTATGQGCKEVLEGSLVASGAGRTKSGTFWKTRPFKQEQVKSSCTLKLKHKTSENVTIRVTFAPGKSVPAALVFEHAPKATAEFKRVGMVALKKKSVTQTKHVFHLGNGARVDRFLRVSCVGLIGDAKNRLHAVSYLMVSGEEAADGAETETEDSGLSDSLVSEGVYKEDGAEFRVSMECGDLEGTLAEAGGRKALGVKNAQRVQDAKTTQKTQTTPRASVSRQSSVSVWERLSNYKPSDNKSVPQPTMFVPGASSAAVAPTAAAGAPASVQSAQSGKTRTPPPPPALRRSLLSKERCQFVDGVLGSFGVGGLEAAEMVKNVVFGNSSMVSTLSQERIDDLIECLPSAEERRLFRSLDRLSLAGAREAEYFMAELAAIDNLAAKVETKWFFADFDARAAVVQDASNLISSACREIQGCSKLHLAIRIILSECSETLQGAKLLDATLLQELKRVAYNAQGSLLHFVAAKLSEAAGSMKVPNLARDLPSCAPASQVALGDVKAELDLLMDGVDEASMAWRADEPAAATIEKRLDAAQSKLASTEAIVTETEADFLECAINSGLDPESIKDSEELFRALLDFSDDLNNAHLENKCIGFLTKSKTAEEVKRAAKKQVVEGRENQKQQIKVNERRQSMASSAGRDSIELMPSPGVATATASTTVSIGGNSPSPTVPSVGAAVPTAGPTNSPQPGPSAPLPAPSPSPLSSRVSVEQLMQSARKSKAPTVSLADREDADTESEASGVADELSTPVRNLLRSSRALIDSFDLRKVNSVSPIKYVRDDENDEADDGLPAAGAAEPAGVPQRGLDDACGVDDVDDDHLCEISSPRMDFESDEAREVQKSAEVTAESSAAEEIQPDEDAATDRPVPAASGTSNARQPTADDIASSIDLGLAAKLLSNADKVKASRSRTSGSSALRRSAHRLPTPQSLRMSQVPVLGSRGRSSRSQMHNDGVSGMSGMSGMTGARAGTARLAQSPRRTPGGYSGEYQLVSKSRSRTEHEDFDNLEGLENLQVSDSPGLTPEQTKAVQALGEVIRQSLPTFSSIEADKQSGLRIDCNLDLDKILSTIILNAGNTPTGPLARGVRGGNETLFDGEAAEELRRDELQHGRRRRANRKALLEPIVPAPLGMGVSVSNTVSKGISPQTLARSLQSSMRASTSVPAYSVSGQTGLGLHANQRSVKGSIHMPNAVENAAGHDEDNRNNHDDAGATHVAVPAQSNLRASKTSRGVSPEDFATQSYSKAVSKDYSKAPAWKEDAVARSDEKFNAKPVFMAGPSNGSLDHASAGVGAEAHALARARASASASAAAPTGAMAHMASINAAPLARPEMISEEDLDAIPTPHHGYNVHDDDDTYGLSPLVGGDDSMAKERLGLWGLRDDWE